MSNINVFYNKYNEKYDNRDVLREVTIKIEKIDVDIKSENIKEYLKTSLMLAKNLLEIVEMIKENKYKDLSLDELKCVNSKLYNELLEESYDSSYANPSYCVSKFDKEQSKILSYLYVKLRYTIEGVYNNKYYLLYEITEILLKIYNYLLYNELTTQNILNIVKEYEINNLNRDEEIKLLESYSVEYTSLNEIIMKSDLSNTNYLYKFGVYISENEIKLSKLISSLEESKVKKIANTIVDAYLKGFVAKNKEIISRKVNRIIHLVGLERITKEVVLELNRRNLDGIVVKLVQKSVNQQSIEDHKFDEGLFLESNYINLKCEAYKNAMSNNEEITKNYLGNIIQVMFGERNITIKDNIDKITLDQNQYKLLQELNMDIKNTFEQYIPKNEVSYTGIAFPIPEISENYKEIFEDIIKINTVESDSLEEIQQTLIEALDKGNYVNIKGTGINETNININLVDIKDSKTQTNFVNCGADVNIPVGEVFTSPQLSDSNGILHLPEILISGIRYENLKLMFKDGYIIDYNCSNYENDDENKKFIKEKLLFPHDTLPIGEFAIGTNTYAYVLSKKHNIVDKLHTLIGEKMGPHIAIGDTCFAWGEDNKLINIHSNKEVIAKDNERSILRKESPQKAYLNTHTDLTIPYDELGELSVITKDKKSIKIIENGRFVLEGTEKLNEPLDADI